MPIPKASEEVRQWLSTRGITRVSETVQADLAAAFPQLKNLRRALRQSGVTLDPIVEGVRQDSLPELARTLIALQHQYENSKDERIRHIIIESKAHAKLVALKRPERQEMIEWMLVWLHDPTVFETWVKLRLRSLAGRVPQPNTGKANDD